MIFQEIQLQRSLACGPLPRTLLSLLLSWALPLGAAEFSGKVALAEGGQPAAAEEYQDAVVYFVPATPVTPVSAAPAPAEMRMQNKTFVPRVLPITAGTEVKFPNLDPILHNAFSTSTNNSFDLGFYGGGEAHTYTFTDPGLVRVYCNVHHSMVAYVLVLNTPHFAGVGAGGEFTLRDLPAGAGDLYVWHPRAEVVKQPMDFTKADIPPRTFTLALTQRRIPQHMNKEGKAYRRSRDRSY
jgi:plastocyanin